MTCPIKEAVKNEEEKKEEFANMCILIIIILSTASFFLQFMNAFTFSSFPSDKTVVAA